MPGCPFPPLASRKEVAMDWVDPSQMARADRKCASGSRVHRNAIPSRAHIGWFGRLLTRAKRVTRMYRCTALRVTADRGSRAPLCASRNVEAESNSQPTATSPAVNLEPVDLNQHSTAGCDLKWRCSRESRGSCNEYSQNLYCADFRLARLGAGSDTVTGCPVTKGKVTCARLLVS
jgi:hypothetical protein